MNYYFFSPVPTVVVKNGRVLGKTSANVYGVCAAPDEVFTLFPDGFSPCEVLGTLPSSSVVPRVFYDGILFTPVLTPRPLAYRFIDEKQTVIGGVELIIGLINDGATKLEITFRGGKQSSAIPFYAKSFEVFDCGNCALVVVKNKLKHVVIFSLDSLKIVLSTTCFDFVADSSFTAKKLFVGAQTYLLSEFYDIGKTARKTGQSLSVVKPNSSDNELIRKLIFLETVKYGGDTSVLVCPRLREKAHLISQFLGRIDYILPPLLSDYPSTFAVISGEKIKYVDISLENGLVCDFEADFSPKS